VGDPLKLNRAVPGGRVEMFAIDDDDYPGGYSSQQKFSQSTGVSRPVYCTNHPV